MKNKLIDRLKDNAAVIVYLTVLAIGIIIALAAIAFRIYALTAYANTPLKDTPLWVVWLLQDGGGSK